MSQHISFRNSKITYYGPFPCDNCGVTIAKMGHEWGGTAFTYPDGPVYPNTEWPPHVCDPHMRWTNQVAKEREHVIKVFGEETRAEWEDPQSPRWYIVDASGAVIHPNTHIHCMTEDDAWHRVYEKIKGLR